MRLSAAIAALPLVLACAGPGRFLPDERPIEPGTFLAADGAALAPDHLAARTAGARYVLVGEAHDRACDHEAQAALVRALAPRGPVVGLEMVAADHQEVLDRFSAGELPIDALPEALAWEARWGQPFSIYRPIFAAAAEAGLPVAALNLPAEVVRRVGAEGEAALPPEIPALIPPPPEQEPMLRRAFEAHGRGGAAAWDRFVRVQSLWDTAMAVAARTWSRRLDRPVIVLAGAGHVANGWGIAHRLRHLDPGAGVVSVMPWRGEAPIDPAEADLFYYCPGGGSRTGTSP